MLEKDVHFLMRHKLMDYSLLLAIEVNNKIKKTTIKLDTRKAKEVAELVAAAENNIANGDSIEVEDVGDFEKKMFGEIPKQNNTNINNN